MNMENQEDGCVSEYPFCFMASEVYDIPQPEGFVDRNSKLDTIGFSDISSDEETIVCGSVNGRIWVIDPHRIAESVNNDVNSRKHDGLSCLRFSKSSKWDFYTTSTLNGIYRWDARADQKPVSQFMKKGDIPGNHCNLRSALSIISADVNCNDQVICAGTELVDEDCYLLFWDVRSPKLLGCYSESHSDDVTEVRFHMTKPNLLCSGSTDGLINVFDLIESEEDDALKFSFNTNSSVDSIFWRNVQSIDTISYDIIGISHSNEIHAFSSFSGDSLFHYARKQLAETAKLRSEHDVYLTSCFRYGLNDTEVHLLMSSTLNFSPRILRLNDSGVKPETILLNQNCLITTALPLRGGSRWVTFDEDGNTKIWNKSNRNKMSKRLLESKTHRRPY